MLSIHRRRGFTLVELLVVIGIIALLVSILLPTLGKVRKSARGVQCQSNLRQLAMAFNMYANGNKMKSFEYDGNFLWMNNLKRYYNNVDAVKFCPDAALPLGSVSYGTAITSWRYSGKDDNGNTTDFFGSYGMNGWLYKVKPTLQSTDAPLKYLPGGRADLPKFITPAARPGAEVPFAADSCWPDAWPDANSQNAAPPNLTDGYPSQAKGNAPNEDFMARFCVARHQRQTTNVVYLDGHAANVPCRELWSQKWHKDWRPPVPNPPNQSNGQPFPVK